MPHSGQTAVQSVLLESLPGIPASAGRVDAAKAASEIPGRRGSGSQKGDRPPATGPRRLQGLREAGPPSPPGVRRGVVEGWRGSPRSVWEAGHALPAAADASPPDPRAPKPSPQEASGGVGRGWARGFPGPRGGGKGRGAAVLFTPERSRRPPSRPAVAMRSGRSRLRLLLLWGALAFWGPQLSVSGFFEGSCTTFPNDLKRCGEPKDRFFYNVTSKSCEPFVYHGCPSNRNRYYTMEECQRFCAQIVRPGFCPPSPRGVTVPCLAECLHDGECGEMEKCCSYGCSLICMKAVTDLCQLPPEHGPCDADTSRWFYDPKVQRCKKFIFGGCAGNANNFKRRQGCRLRCRRRKSR